MNLTSMPPDQKNDAKWWKGSEGHRYALEVLQHPQRRKMLSLIAEGMKEDDRIAIELNLAAPMAEYHLQMLERALVIEQVDGGWMVSPTGELYLKNVEAKS